MKKRKIAIVTGSRAEYGLLNGLMWEIKNDPNLELQIIATAMHLSPEFGDTYRLIEQDGFNINEKVEILLSSDSAVGIAKSVGLCVISFSEVFARLMPDIIVVLGDRFESLGVAQAALFHKIPLAHIHGGELSEGATDDAIRHSITKMAHLHFVAAEAYKKRVIQLGENPRNVFNFGAPGLERITKINLLTRAELENKIQFKFAELNFLITYLPVTIDISENEIALNALFQVLDAFPEAKIIFTRANADEAGRFVNSKIDTFVSHNKERAAVYTTLGDENYLSLLAIVDLVIGNSSSGIIEVPFFQKPTINIGTRQNKRLRSPSIIDCDTTPEQIAQGIRKALSKTFHELVKNSSSAYKLDRTAEKIKNILVNIDLKDLPYKHFYDLTTPDKVL